MPDKSQVPATPSPAPRAFFRSGFHPPFTPRTTFKSTVPHEMTVMIVGFPLVKIQIPNISCIEIIGGVMRGVRWPAASTRTDFPFTPCLDQRPDFRVPFAFPVAGLPTDPSDLLRAGGGKRAHAGTPSENSCSFNRNRSRAILTYSGLISIPIASRFKSRATFKVVPLPMNGSSTTQGTISLLHLQVGCQPFSSRL